MNIHVDNAIFTLQRQGGISRLWRSLLPELVKALPEATFAPDQRPDLFISTYYQRAPLGVKSLAMVYDYIHERLIGAQHPDAADKRTAVREADAVIAISQATADDCARYNGRSATVAYCGGGEHFRRVLPEGVTAFQRQHGILQPYVLVVGRRALYKNVRALYQAWPFWNAHQQHMVVCVGGEPITAADQQFTQRYPWKRLDLDDDDLAAAYSGATATVYPSLFEGFGLPILEAMACGCPVVMGTEGSGREVAGDAGFYCEPLLPLSVAAALEQTTVPSVRFRRAVAGMARSKSFTWAKMAATVADAIREVI